jgi:protein-L-isoaspartate(D-aspartate) O-methyltransferase
MMVIEQQAAISPAATSPAAVRRAMIDSQLRVSGVNDPAVLAAIDGVAREDFVPAERRAVAYADRAIPLGNGRVLAPALTHGQMLVEARPESDDKVLILGGGTGYLAAVIAPLVGSVTVVESDPALAAAAPAKPGIWVAGPLAKGAAKGAPYSLILIDGAVEQLPAELARQLADDGRVVTGLVENGVTRLATGRKAAGTIALFALAEADFAPLGEFAAPRKWSF